jgi:acetyl-CoA carboxylase carboxyl transferase subunit alpha
LAENIQDFEKAIDELLARIGDIRSRSVSEGVDYSADVTALEERVQRLLERVYLQLTPWDQCILARHPKRPYTLDYIQAMCTDWTELHGDRLGHDDPAIVGGIARLDDEWVMVIGHQKGRDLHQRSHRNFGSARPEGYRKALRLMKVAERCRRPIICLVDTPAADPNVPSEERGISEAIARNMRDMFLLTVPIIVVIIGEGGSGGATGLGVADRVLMLEHSIYSVIPPEGCAAILWRDATRGADAAQQLRLTASDAHRFGVVDEIVCEPLGGAHRQPEEAAIAVKAAIRRSLAELTRLSVDELLDARYARFRRLGEWLESDPSAE